jgi:hypothetical protein
VSSFVNFKKNINLIKYLKLNLENFRKKRKLKKKEEVKEENINEIKSKLQMQYN